FERAALALLPAAPRTAPPATRQQEAARFGGLTAREREVAALLSRGLSNKEIAEALFVSDATVATHVKHILAKLDLRSRAQVAVWAIDRGLAHPP
ncbi:MAG: response regulator transcription factor, partial [Thermomicrobiales bacterium]